MTCHGTFGTCHGTFGTCSEGSVTCSKKVGNRSLNGCVGVLADSELD
ncbi:MAG: hypothetical protein LBL62_01155 [Planctomycetaceae bacterium]|nr:hypothetical protein [Planctomycetaceae bacterium]